MTDIYQLMCLIKYLHNKGIPKRVDKLPLLLEALSKNFSPKLITEVLIENLLIILD